MAKEGMNLCQIDLEDKKELIGFIDENNISIVVIGYEAPLVAGLADYLRQNNILVFGPS